MDRVKTLQLKVTKGMIQDVEQEVFDPKSAFELLNLKNQVLDANGQEALTNEKGTALMSVYLIGRDENQNKVHTVSTDISGNIMGVIQCTQDVAVLFLRKTVDNLLNIIYKIEYNKDTGNLYVTKLAEGNFQFGDYISGVFCYENSQIQKVYWVDGKNPLRYINIADVEPYTSGGYITDANYLSTTPTFRLGHHIEVTRQPGGGAFVSGVVQYAFTYYIKNGPETGIVDMTPMYYVAEDTRGIAANETVGCSFRIDVYNPDTSFDYMRVYSIQRNSLNGTPVVKIVKDIKLKKD